MKGIILAGGSGTRLYPITKGTSKQLMHIYDKPMIYYPLSVLMEAGIQDILIITTKEDQPGFIRLLGDGSQFGLNLSYIVQPSPDGLAQAFILGDEFIGDDSCAMILGDNIFHGEGFVDTLRNARKEAGADLATVFGFRVNDPQRFGIMELGDNNKVISVEEKPTEPKSDIAVTGLYFYPKGVSDMAKQVKPSERNELEITSLNNMYLEEGRLRAELLGGGYTWFDTGTFDSNFEAASYIRSIQKNQGRVVSCPETIAYENGWITPDKMYDLYLENKKNPYGEYIKKVLDKSLKR